MPKIDLTKISTTLIAEVYKNSTFHEANLKSLVFKTWLESISIPDFGASQQKFEIFRQINFAKTICKFWLILSSTPNLLKIPSGLVVLEQSVVKPLGNF